MAATTRLAIVLSQIVSNELIRLAKTETIFPLNKTVIKYCLGDILLKWDQVVRDYSKSRKSMDLLDEGMHGLPIVPFSYLKEVYPHVHVVLSPESNEYKTQSIATRLLCKMGMTLLAHEFHIGDNEAMDLLFIREGNLYLCECKYTKEKTTKRQALFNAKKLAKHLNYPVVPLSFCITSLRLVSQEQQLPDVLDEQSCFDHPTISLEPKVTWIGADNIRLLPGSNLTLENPVGECTSANMRSFFSSQAIVCAYMFVLFWVKMFYDWFFRKPTLDEHAHYDEIHNLNVVEPHDEQESDQPWFKVAKRKRRMNAKRHKRGNNKRVLEQHADCPTDSESVSQGCLRFPLLVTVPDADILDVDICATSPALRIALKHAFEMTDEQYRNLSPDELANLFYRALQVWRSDAIGSRKNFYLLTGVWRDQTWNAILAQAATYYKQTTNGKFLTWDNHNEYV